MRMARYVPGKCNIGTVNRLSRFIIGFVLLAIAFWAFFWMKNAELSVWFRLALFFPLYGGFLGIIQAATGFCVLNAKERIFDLR
jgi:hypothetical protein